MGIDLGWLFTVALSYLALLFVIAWCADSNWISNTVTKHPMVYSLSLGVYATSWTYYGSVGLADRSGFAFLTIYLGVTAAFMIGPFLLRPILRLCQEFQLSSIADLLAFRYGGRATGFIVTLFMLVGILPYISLQIRAVTESVQILSKQTPPDVLALMFCLLITIFAILFGARHLTPREKHSGLVLAIAFESAVKLIAMLVAGLFVVTQVFESPAAMNRWAQSQPEMLRQLYAPADTGMWSTLLLLAFCAAFTLPRQYHMTFTENQHPNQLKAAYWMFPLYLLLLNLPIIPILFAGRHLSLSMPADFYVLGITLTLGNESLATLVFIGGLSAASAMMIVTTLALSSMCVNNFVLPATLEGRQDKDFYHRLMWVRRIVITAIIAAGYGFYIVIELNEGLASLGLISFVAAAQLLPGVVGLLFWPRATQTGFLLGLVGGALLWFWLLIMPLIWPSTDPLSWFPVPTDIWTLSTFCTISVNSMLFFIGSLLTQPTRSEQAAAAAVYEDAGLPPVAPSIARSVLHYRYALQHSLGNKVAREELNRALEETRIDANETRVSELRLLHEQLERNLTGLLGPTLAREILHRPTIEQSIVNDGSSDARLLERRLQASREQMRGLTKQLDDLRQYLQNVLRELPLGVCSLSNNGRIYIWNAAMHEVTGIGEREAYDKSPEQLEGPWGELLSGFAQSDQSHQFRCRVRLDDRTASVNLHKADVGSLEHSNTSPAGQVILMEDRTHLDTLESELAHSERLASIGRLAAGVAHEIGNPLTGIASIAQNIHHDVRQSEDSELIEEQTQDILTQVQRINSIVRSLLTFSHSDLSADVFYSAVDLCACIEEALRLVRLSPDVQHIEFITDLPDSAMVSGDANLLMQVFVNLINNACDASPPNGNVRLRVYAEHPDWRVEIIDQGSGIPEDSKAQIFEPFFTTKPVGEGTGLGLSLAYSIIANHQGKLRVADQTTGTRMLVSLPELTDP